MQIDLAVAIVVGTAFTAVVKAFVSLYCTIFCSCISF